MLALEVIGVVLASLLLAIVTAMSVIGLLGMLGAVHLVRCGACHHLVPTSAWQNLSSSCPWCRHQGLLHPIRYAHGEIEHFHGLRP